jgi:hypothetical protein
MNESSTLDGLYSHNDTCIFKFCFPFISRGLSLNVVIVLVV